MNTKTKSLQKLQEEGKTVYQYSTFFRNAFLIFIAMTLLLLIFVVFAKDVFINFYTHLENYSYLWWLGPAVDLLSGGLPFYSEGVFRLPLLVLGCIAQLINWGISAFIFHSITKVFSSIQNGETPFTLKNASYWKKCSQVYGEIAFAYFVLSFLVKPFIISILSPLLASAFFYSLCLIFEYGHELQIESDETL